VEALAPRVPPFLLRVANFYFLIGSPALLHHGAFWDDPDYDA
jgi:hypothetical protein